MITTSKAFPHSPNANLITNIPSVMVGPKLKATYYKFNTTNIKPKLQRKYTDDQFIRSK